MCLRVWGCHDPSCGAECPINLRMLNVLETGIADYWWVHESCGFKRLLFLTQIPNTMSAAYLASWLRLAKQTRTPNKTRSRNCCASKAARVLVLQLPSTRPTPKFSSVSRTSKRPAAPRWLGRCQRASRRASTLDTRNPTCKRWTTITPSRRRSNSTRNFVFLQLDRATGQVCAVCRLLRSSLVGTGYRLFAFS